MRCRLDRVYKFFQINNGRWLVPSFQDAWTAKYMRQRIIRRAKFQALANGLDYLVITIQYAPESPFEWVEGNIEKISVSAGN